MKFISVCALIVFAFVSRVFAQTDTNLISSFNFNGNLFDAISANQNATNHNAILVDNRLNQPNSAFNFSTGNQMITAPVPTNKNNGFTFTCWINLSNYPGLTPGNTYQNIFTMAGLSIYLQSESDSTIFLTASTRPTIGSGMLLQCSIKKKDLPLGKWVQISYTHLPGVSQRFFINGILIKTHATSSDLKNGTSVAFGNFYTGATITNQFFGNIDDIRIYKTALNDSIILKKYENENYTLITGPLSTNNFCQLSGHTFPYTMTGKMDSSNIYYVELSDDSGSFANPTVVGSSITLPNTQSIIFVIPPTITSSPNYKIRMRSSAPLVYGDKTFPIIIKPQPTVNLGGDIHICRGDSAILTAIGAQSYFWTNGDTTASIIVKPKSNIYFAVTGTDSNGCINKDTIYVIVDTAVTPTISFGYNEPKTNFNPTLTSSVLFGNTWYYNNILIPNETNYYIDLTKCCGFGNYFSIVIDSNGCVSDTSEILNCYWEGINSNLYQKINIFPNPSNGEFTIDLSSVSKGIYTVEISNTIGQIVEKFSIDTKSTNTIRTQLKQGVYNVVLKNNNKIYSGIVIIN